MNWVVGAVKIKIKMDCQVCFIEDKTLSAGVYLGLCQEGLVFFIEMKTYFCDAILVECTEITKILEINLKSKSLKYGKKFLISDSPLK